MKPDWKDAPEWANWLAMDEDRDWYWYESEPSINVDVWATIRGKIELATVYLNWQKSKEQRP